MERIVFITGGSSGYGKAMADKFTKCGDTVIIAARHYQKLSEAMLETGCADMFVMDVTLPSDWEKAYAYIMEKYGRLDILVNNAGSGVAIKEVAEQSIEDIDRCIKLNLNSVIYGSRQFAPLMKKQKSGTIINISSVCARQCWPAWSVYAAAKAGVLNFSKGLYTELQPDNIRVTCVIPAAASTGFQNGSGIDEVNNILSVDDIANTVLYVCNLPSRAVVEDVTVWGIDQVVNPL